MTDIDLFDPKNMVDTQITHLGFRQEKGKTDFVIGFRCHGPITDNTRVEFMLSETPDPSFQKITDYWEPTLRNTQGFEQQGPVGPEPFKWPTEFEPCDHPYINGEHLDNLAEGMLFLAFCTIDWPVDGQFNLCGLTTPSE